MDKIKKILITGGSGTIGKAFIKRYQDKFKFYNMSRGEGAQSQLKREFPKAAQLQDKQTWLDWQNEVFSVGKQLDDRRSVAEINAALLRAVPLFDLVDNEEITIGDNVSTKNWRKYFEYRDEVEKEIIKNFGQKGLDEAEEILTASLTTWQKIRREDFDFIRPYWDVADWILD